MNALVQNLKQSLKSLNPRERLIVIAGAATLLVLALYLFAWKPLIEKQAALNTSIKSQQIAYHQMLKLAAEAKQLKGTGSFKAISGGSLQSIINRTAKSALPGAIIKRVEQNRQQAVQVWVDQVGFDDVVKWLGNLQQTKGVRVVALFSERATQTGRVNIRLTLKAG